MIRALFLFIMSFFVVQIMWANHNLVGDPVYILSYSDSSTFSKNIEIPKDTIWPKHSSLYYDDYSNMLSLFLYAKQKYNSFSIDDPNQSSSLRYSPNKQLNIGFGFMYKWIGIGIGLNLGFVNNDDDLYGKTTRMDWQTNLYLKKMVIDFYLQLYQGFYLENPEDIFPDWNKDYEPYIRPDITTAAFGLSGLYIINNKRFSYKSAFFQSAIQKKSAGSFLIGGNFMMQGLTADSSIFPVNSTFAHLPNVVQNNGLYFGALGAYAYNFIIRKHFFVSLSLSTTIQFGTSTVTHDDGESNSFNLPIFHLQPRIALGINKVKWYAGFSAVQDSYFELENNDNKPYTYNLNSGNFRIFLGRRVNWLSKGQLD